MRDNVPNPSNEHRIRALERQLENLARRLNPSSTPARVPDTIRIAEVMDLTAGDVIGVRWFFPEHNDVDTALEPRSDVAQAYVGSIGHFPLIGDLGSAGRTPKVGDIGFAGRINDKWYWLGGNDRNIILQRCTDGLQVVADDVLISAGAGLLSENIGKVVRLRASALLPEACWTILRITECEASICPSVCSLSYTCDECAACWKLTACELVYPSVEYVVKIIASDQTCELSSTLDVGDIVLLDDGLCYTVSRADYCVAVEEAVILKKIYDCAACLDCFEITNCYDASTLTIYKDDHELAVGNVFKYLGQCWEVTAENTCVIIGGTPIRIDDQILAVDVVANCAACGCYTLTPCTTGSPIIAFGADDPAAAKVDLEPLVGSVVRLDDGLCYTVSVTDGSCAGAVLVTVQESYDVCADCLCYDLESCASPGVSDIITYSDLSAYAIGDIIRRAEDGLCYEIASAAAVWGVGAVETTVEDVYDVCADCTSPKYHLTPTCPTCEETYGSLDGCDSEGLNPRTIAGGGTAAVTDHDLSAVVGQFIKVDKICYLVTPAANSAFVTTGFESPLTHSGPFADCTACQKTCLWVVHQVEIDGGELIQIKSRIVVDQVCEEDPLLIEYVEVCTPPA